uniref:Uncharacterized protein n=1 Tax=Chromera velia CCMP2878 TaxID=1169474 RepID=A0A0G4HCP4_9ALVE|eukprot:Cvel_943.t1-p1 / transcript=Cvel_943.t1 / gene=Cvel_943 / organism=Chromera_velia_CCMP2878 / gene_product=hypothetical protein / transcript_product=hypothetical protein / location=Cvel_scaffold30:104077-108205(+) / protein_length=561 / sequence_SO=supercontig / SO=protein_coding / is_pseudo=false
MSMRQMMQQERLQREQERLRREQLLQKALAARAQKEKDAAQTAAPAASARASQFPSAGGHADPPTFASRPPPPAPPRGPGQPTNQGGSLLADYDSDSDEDGDGPAAGPTSLLGKRSQGQGEDPPPAKVPRREDAQEDEDEEMEGPALPDGDGEGSEEGPAPPPPDGEEEEEGDEEGPSRPQGDGDGGSDDAEDEGPSALAPFAFLEQGDGEYKLEEEFEIEEPEIPEELLDGEGGETKDAKRGGASESSASRNAARDPPRKIGQLFRPRPEEPEQSSSSSSSAAAGAAAMSRSLFEELTEGRKEAFRLPDEADADEDFRPENTAMFAEVQRGAGAKKAKGDPANAILEGDVAAAAAAEEAEKQRRKKAEEEIPTGFFDDPEQEALARGEEKPSDRKARELEADLKRFEAEIDLELQRKERIRARLDEERFEEGRQEDLAVDNDLRERVERLKAQRDGGAAAAAAAAPGPPRGGRGVPLVASVLRKKKMEAAAALKQQERGLGLKTEGRVKVKKEEEEKLGSQDMKQDKVTAGMIGGAEGAEEESDDGEEEEQFFSWRNKMV